MTPDETLTADIANFYADPLGYVMYIFPWDSYAPIQIVELQEPWATKYGCKYGPEKWACEFLDELGGQIRARGFDGRTAVAPLRYTTSSGHGIGKSTLVAWIIKFILDTRPFSKGIVTANTSDQLRTKTWAELGKWHKISSSEHLYDFHTGKGSMALVRKSDNNTWRCDAMTCREENSESFQGLHAANSTPFYIFDEASGIPDKIWEARAGGATDGEPMSFDFGNPTRKSGYFFENCMGRYRHRFTVRQIDSRDVSITNKGLINEWLEDYGEDDDFFKVRVRGVFPSAGDVQFIPSDLVEDASARELVEDNHAALIIGVDVARFGNNESVIYPRIGNDARSFPPRRFLGLDTVQLTGKVIECLREFRALGKECKGLFVDGGGIGGGVVDQLRHLGYAPTEVQFGGKATNNRVYRFKSDEMWGTMKEGLNKLCLPPSTSKHYVALRNGLTQREFGYTILGNKVSLESKKDMQARGVDSPDIADALALTYAAEIAPEMGDNMALMNMMNVKSDYDPLEQEL